MEEKNVVIYIKTTEQKSVKDYKVLVGDICEVSCSDKDIMKIIYGLEIYNFDLSKKKKIYKKVISVMEIINLIQQRFVNENISIVSIGATDVLIEYDVSDKGKVFEMLKVFFICILIFFGSAFTIMAFNNDISIKGVFEQLYSQFTGRKKPTVSELEIAYSLGLAVGIMVFFNHIGSKKLTDDVTPIEVEMNKHKKDTCDTIIDMKE